MNWKHKTMIFDEEQLQIINGLARLKRIQIKDVLYQLLEHSINNLDDEAKKESLKLGKYQQESKRKIYFK